MVNKRKTNKIDFSCVTVAHVRKAIKKFKKDPKRKARSTEIRNKGKFNIKRNYIKLKT